MISIINKSLEVLSPAEKSKLKKLVLSDFLISILDILFLIALLYIVNSYTLNQNPKISNFTFPFFKQQPLLLIGAFLILFTFKNLFAYRVFKNQYSYVYNVASRISKNKLIEYLRGDYSNYVEIDSSVHIHRINQQPIEFCHYVLKGILQIFSQALLLLVTLTAILLFNAPLFLLLFILLVPPVAVVGYILKKQLHEARTNAKLTSEKALQHLQEALAGFVESKIHDKTAFFTDRYYLHQNRLNKYLSDQQIIQNIPSRFVEVFAIFGLFILILLNSLNTSAAALSITTIGAFVAASYKIIPGVVKIMNSLGQVKTYAYTSNDLRWNDINYANSTATESSGISSIKLDKISFDYNKKQVLDNFSMLLNQGDFVGMSGPSGKGKTTMLNVLLGFISPVEGNILINNIKNLQTDFWQDVSYVKQQPFLLNGTIRTNVTLNENLENDDRLVEVINITGVQQIVEVLPKGLDTLITEQGKNLSGGQRQRIALARALYKKFDLLILDEPFSELDEKSEITIVNYLQEISIKGKIILLISHNKKTLSFCNRTISMDEYN